MPVITEFDPTVALQQAAPYVEAFDRPEVGASRIDPLTDPDAYSAAIHQLSPRFGTPEERAAAREKGESGNLARQALVEKRANWGAEHDRLIQDIAGDMGLTVRGYPFIHERDTPVDVAVVVEGANETNELRLGHVLQAHGSGLLVVKRVVLPADSKRKPTNLERGTNGLEAADGVVAKAFADDPDRIYGRNGKPKVEVHEQRASKPNTLTAISEVMQDATVAERAGRWAVSSSAIYVSFMAFEAGAAALQNDIDPEQVIIGGVAANARAMAERAKAPNAFYAAEIVRTAESAAHLIVAQQAAGLR